MRSRPAWRTGLIAAAIALVCAPSPASADTFQRDRTPLPAAIRDGATTAPAHSSGSGGSLVRMIVGLVIVIAVIYGIYWLLRQRSKAGRVKGDSRIAVVATTPLGPNRAVHLVRVGEELMLVGSAEQGVTQLRVYGPEEAAALDLDPEGTAAVYGSAAPGKTGPLTVSDLERSRGAGGASWKGNNWSSVADEIRRRTLRG